MSPARAGEETTEEPAGRRLAPRRHRPAPTQQPSSGPMQPLSASWGVRTVLVTVLWDMPQEHGARNAVQMQDRMHVHPARARMNVHPVQTRMHVHPHVAYSVLRRVGGAHGAAGGSPVTPPRCSHWKEHERHL